MAHNKDQPLDSGDPPLPEIDLRDARLAAFLAWLVPGLGHLYQRRTGKGLLFMICILGTFGYGMSLGKGRVVYAPTTNPIGEFAKFRERWVYAGQIAVGLPALPAYIQTWRVEDGSQPLFGDNFLRPPYTPDDVTRLFGKPTTRKQESEREVKYFTSDEHSNRSDGNKVSHATERQKWHHDIAFGYEVGTAYTLIAGLMNILAICDARWGPFVAPPKPEDDKPDDSK